GGRLCGARRHRRPVCARHGRPGAARFFWRHLWDDSQLRSPEPAHQRRISRARSRAHGPSFAHQGHPPAFFPPPIWRASGPGAPSPADVLYEAVSEGGRHAGMEHWLPLFHQRLETLFDYLAGTPFAIEPLAEEAAHERLAQIADYFQARKDALDQDGAGAPYKPLPPDRLYLAESEWRGRLDASPLAKLTPFAAPGQEPGGAQSLQSGDNVIAI